ncbi:MAG: uncharacterized protein JWM98_1655 [Thermoleophilia bacterium]|nr:uncharacterized protein [Thermoleophilia bacterium]
MCAVAAAVASAMGGSAAHGATSAVVVSMDVPSATTLDTSLCATGVPGKTSFGVVQPGQSVVTGTDCTVRFGSSNDTSSLRLSQGDAQGRAMWTPPTGVLDTTFATSGVLTVDLPNGIEHVWGAAEAFDGSLYFGGSSKNVDGGDQVTVGKFTATGSPAPGFGTGGIVTYNLDAGASANDFAWDLGVQPDGKPVLSVAGPVPRAMRLVAATGAPDPSFGGTGSVALPSGLVGKKLEVGADGSIVISGTSYAGPNQRCAIAKVTSSGIMDSTFGAAGMAYLAFAGKNVSCDGLLVQPDGMIVLAGRTNLLAADDGSILARFRLDGSLDPAFGTGGYRTADRPGTGDEYQDLAIDVDGSLLVVGLPGAPGTRLSRFDATGTLLWDRVDGTAPQTGRDVVILPDGRFMTAGNYTTSAVARYSSSGVLDPTFNTTGWRSLTAPSEMHENGAILLHDGRYLAAGSSATGAWQAAMFSAVTIPDFTGGSSDWSVGANGMFGACLATVGGSASASWTSGTGCPAANGAGWHDVEAAPETVATAPTNITTATAGLRFGLRVSTTQAAGTYLAPVALTVVAPLVP